jgi:hypothetical protein
MRPFFLWRGSRELICQDHTQCERMSQCLASEPAKLESHRDVNIYLFLFIYFYFYFLFFILFYFIFLEATTD